MPYQSIVSRVGDAAPFPAFLGERVYMRPFWKKAGLPDDLARWQPLVDSMLVGVDTDQPIYLMIDQKHVRAGEFHRRSGLHIDGYWGGNAWQPISAHGGDGGMPAHHRPAPGHSYEPPAQDRHRPAPSHSYIPPERGHSPAPSRHTSASNSWTDAPFCAKEAIILASNVTACLAYSGEFDGPIGDMGDCGSLPLAGMKSHWLEAGSVFAGNVTMLHETTACLEDCDRTVVRLNVPGWSPTHPPEESSNNQPPSRVTK